MADYAIGDIQGCFEPFMRLLNYIDFDITTDQLWLVGDLVNRGPESLELLRFLKSMPRQPFISLGNHDLHLLSCIFANRVPHIEEDTLLGILNAPDCESLGHWLRHQAILHHDTQLNIVMTHAGIAPIWDLETAKRRAKELEAVLHGPEYCHFLNHMYGNSPNHWSETLEGIERLRLITNYFTRMRFCNANGDLDLHCKEKTISDDKHHYPWFSVPNRVPIDAEIVFGHWAALEGHCPVPRIHAIDTGYIWGGTLTALRLQDKKRFSVHQM